MFPSENKQHAQTRAFNIRSQTAMSLVGLALSALAFPMPLDSVVDVSCVVTHPIEEGYWLQSLSPIGNRNNALAVTEDILKLLVEPQVS